MSDQPIEGTWPAHCEQRAFVEGARWWQYYSQGATMFPSERDAAETEAVKRYGEPKFAARAAEETEAQGE